MAVRFADDGGILVFYCRPVTFLPTGSFYGCAARTRGLTRLYKINYVGIKPALKPTWLASSARLDLHRIRTKF